MAYRAITFQECFGFGWIGGAEFKTRVVELISGRERRNAEWSQPRHRYSAPLNNISSEQYAQIKAMHLNCRGKLDAFQFLDELDYQSDEDIFDAGDGTKTTFQLGKYSIVDNVPYKRNVYAPDQEGFQVYADDVLVDPGSYTVDWLRGIITFNTAPANNVILTWSGTFKVWVRFDNDYLPFAINNPGTATGQVDLIEVPPPPPTT